MSLKQYPDAGDMLIMDGFVMVVTAVNFQTGEVAGRFFETEEEAEEWVYKVSLRGGYPGRGSSNAN
jgi:hypothetical protein